MKLPVSSEHHDVWCLRFFVSPLLSGFRSLALELPGLLLLELGWSGLGASGCSWCVHVEDFHHKERKMFIYYSLVRSSGGDGHVQLHPVILSITCDDLTVLLICLRVINSSPYFADNPVSEQLVGESGISVNQLRIKICLQTRSQWSMSHVVGRGRISTRITRCFLKDNMQLI